MTHAVDLVVPGDPATLTGGYLYDRRILEGLAELGWRTRTHALGAGFPEPSPAALTDAAAVLAAIPAERAVIVDGLALAGLAPVLENERRRLCLVALVHHPVGDETGLPADVRERLHREERRACDAVERIVVTSRWTAGRLTRLGIPFAQIRIVEPGTARRFAPPRTPDPGDGDTLRLLCVAALVPRKGHALLLDALAKLADRPWRLDCVGSPHRDPATARAVRAQRDRHGLAERVALLGELDAAALDACYARAHAFVLPSDLEGYGMAFAEAITAGLPIIGTTAGAIPDTVRDAGLLVPPGDANELTAALARLLDDEPLRRRLAARATERMHTLPTWPEASARFAAVLAELSVASANTPDGDLPPARDTDRRRRE